jgi:hypothetical protein
MSPQVATAHPVDPATRRRYRVFFARALGGRLPDETPDEGRWAEETLAEMETEARRFYGIDEDAAA